MHIDDSGFGHCTVAGWSGTGPPITLSRLQTDANMTAYNNGEWKQPRAFRDLVTEAVSELHDALEEYNDGAHPMGIRWADDGEPKGIPIELADVLIRVADMSEQFHINLTEAVRVKMEYNRTKGSVADGA